MHLLGVTCFMAALGIPMNLILLFVARRNSDKISTAEILITHLSFANILQLISRILTLVIPDQNGICYPVVSLCKLSLWTLCTSRRVSMLFTFYLGLFRLIKIKNRYRFNPTNLCLQLALLGNWVLLNFACLPPLLLIPEDRPSLLNVTKDCVCSVAFIFTDKDNFARLYYFVIGSGSLYIVTVLTCYVSIHIIHLLLKHNKTIFINGTLNRFRTRQQDIIAIKAIVALLVSYATCTIASCTLRLVPKSDYTFYTETIFADIYNVISPFILGLGYSSFRKTLCVICNIGYQKSITEPAVTIS